MQLKRIFQLMLPVGCVAILSCSNLNNSTDLGKDAIRDVDPSITQFSGNFLPFSDSTPVDSAYSIATPVDTSIGKPRGVINVGKIDVYTARGSTAFPFDSITRQKHANDTLKSIVLRFDTTTVDSITYTIPTKLSVYDLQKYPLVQQSDSVLLKASDLIVELNKTDTVTKIDSSNSKRDTIRVSSYRDTIKDPVTFSAVRNIFHFTGTSKDTSYFKILISSDSDLVFLKPTGTLELTFKHDTSTIKETIYSDYSNYVVYETPAKKSSNDHIPITSSATGRTAVFKLDLTKYWANMSNSKFDQILSTTLIIKDSTLQSQNTSKIIPIRYYVSPIQFNSVNTIWDTLSTVGFGGSTENDSIPLRIEPFLQKMLSTKPKTVYLYVINHNTSVKWQETYWRKPILTAIFSNTH